MNLWPPGIAGSFIVVVATALALVIPLGCKRPREAGVQELPPVTVEAITVAPRNVPETYDVVGTVRPRISATVAAKLTAAILAIPVNPGSAVNAGDPLAQLDDREARAEFERAESEYARNQQLLADSVVTQAEFDSSEERFQVAKAALSHTTITAPFDGIVAEKLCDVGDLATPGRPLFVVDQPTAFRLEMHVPERFAAVVKVGTTFRVLIEATGQAADGVVGEVVPVTDPATRTFLVKVDLPPQEGLKSGMFGRAQLVVGERAGFFVPQSAVRERGQLSYVYVVHDGRARMRLVKTGKTIGDQIELLSGVQGGETIVLSGEVADGQRVSL